MLVVAVAVTGLVLASGDEPEEAAPAEPEPEPEPDPPPPVEGVAELAEVVDLSVAGTQLFGSSMPQDEPVPVDDAAVDRFVTTVADELDRHLSDLQTGGPGLTGAGFVGPDDVLALTDPDRLVAQASYRMIVGVRGEPEWAVVEVVVDRADGSSGTAGVTFVADGGATLVAAEATPSWTAP